MEYLVQILTGFLGSLGFAFIFNIKKVNVFPSAFGGIVSWGIFLISYYFTQNNVISYFISSVLTTIYAEIIAMIIKSPTTIILICSFIPLVPGGSLYYTMRYAFREDWEQFMLYGLDTLKLAVALAFGIIIVSTVIKTSKNILLKK